MRLIFGIFALLALAAPARADERTDSVSEILACGSVRGDKARLRCFEKALPAVRDAHPDARALADARAEEARLAAQEEAKEEFGLSPTQAKANDPFEEKEFGAEDLPRVAKADDDDEDENDGEVNSIEAEILEVGRNAYGKIFVVLANGQVWRQIDGDSSSPYIPKKKEGLTARIKKAALGSYMIKVSGTRDAFKARRIK